MKLICCSLCGGAGITLDSQRFNIVAISCWFCQGKGVIEVRDDFYPASDHVETNIRLGEF